MRRTQSQIAELRNDGRAALEGQSYYSRPSIQAFANRLESGPGTELITAAGYKRWLLQAGVALYGPRMDTGVGCLTNEYFDDLGVVAHYTRTREVLKKKALSGIS